jgi:alpha-methylacyl-CoA racemase
MVEGAALLALNFNGYVSGGVWTLERGSNMLDSGAPYYDVYETSDGRFVAVGAIEEPFYEELLRGLELDPAGVPDRDDRDCWPELREIFRKRFGLRTRDEWTAVFDGTDACVTPVLTFTEAPSHPHNAARSGYSNVDGIVQPSPAPRFSRTPSPPPHGPREPGADTERVLASLGFDEGEVARLAER